MTELQNQLINQGYITTRVVAPPQDLTTGRLILHIAKVQLKDGTSTEALISVCSNSSSDVCKTERKNAQDALESYHTLNYQNPKMQQVGYQEIDNLLKQTSQESELMRQIYTGYKNSYIAKVIRNKLPV